MNSISRRKVDKAEGVGRGIKPDDELVSKEQDEFVRRHAYFTKIKLKGDDPDYYYWDYQKMKDQYGILEYGLKPGSVAVGGLPEMPHPWCVENVHEVEDLVTFLLTL